MWEVFEDATWNLSVLTARNEGRICTLHSKFVKITAHSQFEAIEVGRLESHVSRRDLIPSGKPAMGSIVARRILRGMLFGIMLTKTGLRCCCINSGSG